LNWNGRSLATPPLGHFESSSRSGLRTAERGGAQASYKLALAGLPPRAVAVCRVGQGERIELAAVDRYLAAVELLPVLGPACVAV